MRVTRLAPRRVDRLDSVQLVTVPDITSGRAGELFASLDSAVAALAAEFRTVWRARSADSGQRAFGSLELESGAYVQSRRSRADWGALMPRSGSPRPSRGGIPAR